MAILKRVLTAPFVKSAIKITLMALGVVAIPVQAGVIAHYSFDGDASESSNSALDLQQPLHAFPNLYSPGQFGDAVYLPGDSNLSVQHPALLGNGNTFSLSFWFQSGPASLGVQQLVGFKNDGFFGATKGYSVNWHNDTVVGTSYGGFSSVSVASPPVLATAEFTHVSLISDAITQALSLYINGVLVDMSNNSIGEPPDASSVFEVGGVTGSFADFAGAMDELWLFDSALSSQQVSNLYHFNNVDGDVAPVPEPQPLPMLVAMIGLLAVLRRSANRSLYSV